MKNGLGIAQNAHGLGVPFRFTTDIFALYTKSKGSALFQKKLGERVFWDQHLETIASVATHVFGILSAQKCEATHAAKNKDNYWMLLLLFPEKETMDQQESRLTIPCTATRAQ